jgi:hypothetical protein
VYLGGQDENAEDNEEDEGTESYGSWMGWQSSNAFVIVDLCIHFATKFDD